jgi:AbrB family looped-hinge helix DNA binding protein
MATVGLGEGISVGKVNIQWELLRVVGICMSEAESTVKIDEKGRIMLPEKVRKATKLSKGAYVTVKAKNETITIEPAKSIADKYHGVFQITNWPEDLDEFAVEATRKWWATHGT